jgi:hypothetical protein
MAGAITDSTPLPDGYNFLDDPTYVQDSTPSQTGNGAVVPATPATPAAPAPTPTVTAWWNGLQPWQRYAIGAGGAALFLGGTYAIARSVYRKR